MKLPSSNSSTKKRKSLSNVGVKTQLPIIITDSTQDKENGDVLVLSKKARISTGIEKGEEKEIHLQDAMESQRATLKGDSLPSTSIPIPKVEVLDNHSTQRYIELQKTQMLTRRNDPIITSVTESTAEFYRESYDLDEEDAIWLEKVSHEEVRISIEDFEKAMEILEVNSRKSVLSFAGLYTRLPKMERRLLDLIYDYWLKKRTKLCMSLPSASLLPTVPTDADDDDKDPYVAFRKRENEKRRRSVRIALNASFISSACHSKPLKTEEEKAAEQAEKLERLSYEIDHNSELDGQYKFQRNRYCTYKMSGDE